MTEMTSNTAE